LSDKPRDAVGFLRFLRCILVRVRGQLILHCWE